jgi:hypothetical protein
MFDLGSDRVTVYHVLSWVETGFRGDGDEIHRPICTWAGLE